MKLYIIIPLLMLFHQMGVSQQKTEAYFGVSGRTDVCRDIFEMYDKGYYITGRFEGEYEHHYGWNIKTGVNLELLYDKVFEHASITVAPTSSVADENGNIYTCGTTTYNDQWPFVTKLDSCGVKQWCKILYYNDEFNFGSSRDILLTKNDEIVILTAFESGTQIDKAHIIGLSLDGDVLWKIPYASKNTYPWIENPSLYSIKEINNDYYLSGYCYWPYPDDTTHLFLRPLFIGIDSLFNEKWILPFAPLDSVFGDAFTTIAINDSILMGVGVRRAYNSSNEDNAILMFYNKDGEVLGYNEIYNDQIGPDIKGSDIRNIVRINDSLFMTASQFGLEYSANPYGELIIDTAANLFNFLSHPNATAYIPGIIKTYDNNFVIATNIKESKSDDDIYLYKIDENLQDVPFDPTPHTYDSLCPGGIQSGTISLTDCFVWTNIGEAPTPQEYYAHVQTIPIKAYPNPVTTGMVTFEFENTQYHWNMELRCFNVYGELVHKEKVYKHQRESKMDIQNWKKGIYFATVYSNGLPVGRCKFVGQ